MERISKKDDAEKSYYEIYSLDEIFDFIENTRFLVEKPAVENPEFAAAFSQQTDASDAQTQDADAVTVTIPAKPATIIISDRLIGDVIKDLLLGRSMTQKDFADALEVTPSQMSCWITNQKIPSLCVVDAMAKYLDIDRSLLRAARQYSIKNRESKKVDKKTTATDPETEMNNANHCLCRTCQFRDISVTESKTEADSQPWCNYILHMGRSRKCRPGTCDVYVKGDRLSLKDE